MDRSRGSASELAHEAASISIRSSSQRAPHHRSMPYHITRGCTISTRRLRSSRTPRARGSSIRIGHHEALSLSLARIPHSATQSERPVMGRPHLARSRMRHQREGYASAVIATRLCALSWLFSATWIVRTPFLKLAFAVSGSASTGKEITRSTLPQLRSDRK